MKERFRPRLDYGAECQYSEPMTTQPPKTQLSTNDEPTAVDVTETDLIEDISIDGMCGVY